MGKVNGECSPITLHNGTWFIEQGTSSVFRILFIMSDDLFESFEAFDASVMDVVNATTSYKMKTAEDNLKPVDNGKENIEKRSYLRIHSFARISRLGEESIHVEDEEIQEETRASSSADYDDSCKAKNYARLMNVLKNLNSKESLENISKEHNKPPTMKQKRRSSGSLLALDSDVDTKRRRVMKDKANTSEREGENYNHSTSKESNVDTQRSQLDTKSPKSLSREKLRLNDPLQ